METTNKPSILFVCTHNSARSQMAEALMRHDFGHRFDVYSAGTEQTSVKPNAIRALREIHIDTSVLYSKTVEQLAPFQADIVVTVCDNAKESCPFVVGKTKTIHHSFEDPSTKGATHAENLRAFCDTRDEIREWIQTVFGAWDGPA